MNTATALLTNLWKGFLAGLGAVLIAAIFGFVIGCVALAQGHRISLDFESNISGLTALVAFSIGYWGIPSAMVGALVAGICGILSQWRSGFNRHMRKLAFVLVLSVWTVALQISGLPFRQIILSQDEKLSAKGIFAVYVCATLGAAYVLGGRIAVNYSSRNSATTSG